MTGRVPVIDVYRRYSENEREWRQIAAEIGAACGGIGFFRVIKHGVSEKLIQEAFQKSAALFALGAVQKEAMWMLRSRHNRGYAGFAVEALDPSKPPDLKEAFNIGLDLDAGDPEPLRTSSTGLWPPYAACITLHCHRMSLRVSSVLASILTTVM